MLMVGETAASVKIRKVGNELKGKSTYVTKKAEGIRKGKLSSLT
jgi:hypothetical protein